MVRSPYNTGSMFISAWGTRMGGPPPQPEKLRNLLLDLALSGREQSILRVQNCADLFGMIANFWDSLGAESWPLVCLFVFATNCPGCQKIGDNRGGKDIILMCVYSFDAELHACFLTSMSSVCLPACIIVFWIRIR